MPGTLCVAVTEYSARAVVWTRPQSDTDLPAWWWNYTCTDLDEDRWLGPGECALLMRPVQPGTVEMLNFRLREYWPDGHVGLFESGPAGTPEPGFMVGVAEEGSEDIVAALWAPWKMDTPHAHNVRVVVDNSNAGSGRMRAKVGKISMVLREYRGADPIVHERHIYAGIPVDGPLQVGVWFDGDAGHCSVRCVV